MFDWILDARLITQVIFLAFASNFVDLLLLLSLRRFTTEILKWVILSFVLF